MTNSGYSVSQVLSQIDAAYGNRTSGASPMAEAEHVITPAIQAYSIQGSTNGDASAFNAALIYTLHKYYPITDPNGDRSKPRFYFDDLYRRTVDDTTVYSLQSDVTAWITANKGSPVSAFVPGVSNLTPGTTDSLIGPSSALTNPLSGIELLGQVAAQFYDVVRWLTSPANWWRIGKFLLGMGMIYFGVHALVTGSDSYKAVQGTVSQVAGKAALAA